MKKKNEQKTEKENPPIGKDEKGDFKYKEDPYDKKKDYRVVIGD